MVKKTSEELMTDLNESIVLINQANKLLSEAWQSESSETVCRSAEKIFQKMFQLSEETEKILKDAGDNEVWR